MQTYSRAKSYATRSYTTLANGGFVDTKGETSVPHISLTAVNGNVQGVKSPNTKKWIKPNPTKFTRCIYEPGVRMSIRNDTQNGYSKLNVQTITGPYVATGQVNPSSANLSGSVNFNATRDRCMEKIYDDFKESSANLIVDLAEGAQTLRMLRNAIGFRKLITTFFKDVLSSKKARSLSPGQKRLDYVTNKWLEYRYGWMPLLGTIYDVADNLRRKARPEYVYIQHRSGRQILQNDVLISGVGTYVSPKEIREFTRMRYRTEIGITFRNPNDDFRLSDWTSLNPLGIAWELVPFSFVADWFVNVGQYLELWENFVLYNKHFVSGYETNSYEEINHLRTYGYSSQPFIRNPNGSYLSGFTRTVQGTARSRITYKDRRILYTLPLPSNGLEFRAKLNAKRFLDAASLVHVVFAKNLRHI